MSSLGSPNPFFIAGKKAYEIERSLRFDPNDTYMERTPSSSGNRKTFTISIWFKLGIVKEYSGADGRTIFSTGGGGSGSYATGLSLRADAYGGPTLEFTTMLGAASGSNYGSLITSAFIRDPSAWYHVVVKVDTTQSTSSNRLKMYINGVEQTNFSTETYPNQNVDTYMNVTDKTGIGANRTWANQNTKYNYFGGYLAEFHFLDGTAYDASYFGETDSITGQWIPKVYTGGNYGTNGFYLKFSDNSGTTATTLGKDSSGNGNNFTPNNFSVSAGIGNDSVADTPTNNFCTLNSLDSSGNNPSNGNLQGGTAGTSGWRHTRSTFELPSTGKWYWEYKIPDTSTDGSNGHMMGIAYSNLGFTQDINSDSTGLYGRQGDGKYNNSSSSPVTNSHFTSIANNDIVQFAYDADGQKLYTGKNNTWELSADPSAGSNPNWTSVASGGFPMVGSYGSNRYVTVNFGQQGFVYTPPTGYKALNSANLPNPTIKLPNKHFDTLLWTGNGSTQSITGLNFKPDWVWTKPRSQAYGHGLFDSVRGGNQRLDSGSSQEDRTSEGNISFESDGFNVTSSHSTVNQNASTMVAWNWNAGDTDGKTYTVTVVSDSGNKFRFDGYGTSAVTLDLAEGGTYTFNYPSAHPFRFSETADGTHGGGSEYTTGVTHNSSTQVTIVVAASAPQLYYYCASHSGMGGAVNTNSTLGSSNFDGAIQSTVKVNASVGLSIITYTGTESNTTVGHGLGVTPQAAIFKRRDSTGHWMVYHQSLGNTHNLYLSTQDSQQDDNHAFNDTSPTSSVFSLGISGFLNANSGTFVGYIFSEVAGYSKFGSYEGNQNADGPFVFLGFTPAWIMIKNADNGSSRNWCIIDATRTTFNKSASAEVLFANASQSESVANNDYGQFASKPAVDILSNGFKVREGETSAYTQLNRSNTHIFFAFAKSPFKNARAR